MKTNILIDGHFLLYNTYSVYTGYGSKMTKSEGKEIILATEKEQGLFIRAVATNLCSILQHLPLSGKVIFCVDSKSWRKDITIEGEGKGYKIGRTKDKESDWTNFYNIIKELKPILESFGIIYSIVNKAEGDDLIHVWSKRFLELGENSIVISADKDLKQLATGAVEPWVTIWRSTINANAMVVSPGWKSWLNKEVEVSIFDFTSVGKDKEIIKKHIGQGLATIEEIDIDEFAFIKILIGDAGDDVPSIYEKMGKSKKGEDKLIKFTEAPAKKVVEHLKAAYPASRLCDLLLDDEIIDYTSGLILRTLKDVDNKTNRTLLINNIKRNMSLVWLDEKVLPEYLLSDINSHIKECLSWAIKNPYLKVDRIKLLEKTKYAKTTADVPKNFDLAGDINFDNIK
jgi:5'-3' exonuclease